MALLVHIFFKENLNRIVIEREFFHHAVTVRNWLNSVFNEHWIGRDGPILWPPRSPDLIILDFYLWGRLKQIVYRESLENDEQLKTKIQNAVKSLSIEEIRNSFNEFRTGGAEQNRKRRSII
ncbi:hypothetical protein NQ318_020137 [Aromia moschata]|uniref:Uncharacterized protein n=1 Tax=Aromia moschata TaxID=1265417 RepID=A0AAV8ZB90_9CUCU|nr:hypothetical protein NQ318_020137 [Aromia moschata]